MKQTKKIRFLELKKSEGNLTRWAHSGRTPQGVSLNRERIAHDSQFLKKRKGSLTERERTNIGGSQPGSLAAR